MVDQAFLLADGYKKSRYNICRFAGRYYAIHQEDGAFDIEKIKGSRLHFDHFEGASLKEVQKHLDAHVLDRTSPDSDDEAADKAITEPPPFISELEPGNSFLSYAFEGKEENIIEALSMALRKKPGKIILIGEETFTALLQSGLNNRGIEAGILPWNLGQSMSGSPFSNEMHVFCLSPDSDQEWEKFDTWREFLGSQFVSIWELAMPFATMTTLQKVFDYNSTSFQKMCGFYAGDALHAPATDKLNEMFPFEGRSVIEFGPSDGNHTGLISKLGAKKILCVEGRPENVIKLLAAKFMMQWDHVEILAENFHAIDVKKHGRFDIAYAHGVYYHTSSPFHFLEKLCDLSDNIFIGGWCASEKMPRGERHEWEYKGETYKGEIYFEPHHFLSGIQSKSVYLDADSLKHFYTVRGFDVVEVSREFPDQVTGDFLRILCNKNFR